MKEFADLDFGRSLLHREWNYSKTVQRENIKRIKNVLNEKGIHIVDQINDAYSDIFCEKYKNFAPAKI